MKHLITLLSILISFSSVAAVLKPLSFDRQLKKANGVIFGTYLGSNVKRSRDGQILTEVSFSIKKSVGVNERSIINRKYFKAYYEGGVWNGLKYQNKNEPTFSTGQDYIVILKETANGFKISEDKLGVYNLERDGKERILVSQAFPDNEDIGVTKIDQFDVWVKISYGSYLQKIHSDKYIFKSAKKSKRSPASQIEEQSSQAKSNIHILWYVLVFGVIGALHIRSRRS